MFIIRLFVDILSLVFSGLSLLMKGLMYLLDFVASVLLLWGPIIMFISRGFDAIQDIAVIFVSGIVVGLIAFLCAWLELDEKLEDISDDLALLFYEPQDTHSTSSSSHRSTNSSYSSSSSYSDSYSGSSSYDSKYHDELDAVQHAMEISKTYGEDWRGYDPEAPGPDPDTFVDIDL